MFTSNITTKKKCELCDLNHDTDVGTRKADLIVLETADLVGFSAKGAWFTNMWA